MPEQNFLADKNFQPGDYMSPVNQSDESVGDKLLREVDLLGAGVSSFGKSLRLAVTENKVETASKVAMAAGLGGVLSVLSSGTSLRGIATRALVAGLGVATAVDMAPKAFELGTAFQDNWGSADNWQKNKEAVQATMGPFLADAAILTVAGGAGDRIAARYRGMFDAKIPPFRIDGHLPNGTHPASWNEFSSRFGTNDHRLQLLDGMKVGLAELRSQGFEKAYVGGSFVSSKAMPHDFDVTFKTSLPQMQGLLTKSPILTNVREQEARWGGSLLPSFKESKGGGMISYFRTNRNDRPVGLVELDLKTLPHDIKRVESTVPMGMNWWNNSRIGMHWWNNVRFGMPQI